jgi:ACS family tartrate transporter-like MFS transporter
VDRANHGHLARGMAYFMTAICLAGVLGNPVNGVITRYLNGVLGLYGWQWLFLLEGIPSILLGLLVPFALTDRPEEARWLNEEERTWLAGRVQEEERHRQQRHGADLLRVLVDPRVWLLIAIYFTVAVTSNAAGAHYPRLIKEHITGDDLLVGLLGAIPPCCAILGMTLLGTHSDRTGERRGHVAFAAFVAAGGWALVATSPSPGLVLLGLCLAQMGMMSMLPTFWALPTAFLSGAAAAGGIALINSLGNIGGLLGALILGKFGLWAMVGTLFVGGALALTVRQDRTLERAP